MTLDGPPPSTPKLRLVGIIWGVVGVLAIIVGLATKAAVVGIFGAITLVAGVLVYSAQTYREHSAERTARRMAGGPVSPMTAPAPVPDVGPGAVPSGLHGRAGYRRRPWMRNETDRYEQEAPEPGLEQTTPADRTVGNTATESVNSASSETERSGWARKGRDGAGATGDGLTEAESGADDTDDAGTDDTGTDAADHDDDDDTDDD